MPPVIWGQAGDGVTASTMPLLVAPHRWGHAQALVLPGVAGNYASSPDVNLLDADTAHLEQTLTWGNSSNATVTLSSDAAYFGTSAGLATVTATGYASVSAAVARGAAASAGTQYTHSLYVLPSEAVSIRASVTWRDGVDTFLSGFAGTYTSCPANQWTQVAVTATAPALTEKTQPYFEVQSATAGALVYFDAVCLREGSDSTFIPSTRITGDIDIRAHVAPKQWNTGAFRVLLSRWTPATDNRCWYLAISSAGKLQLAVDADGTAGGSISVDSSVTLSSALSDGNAAHIRATRDASTGDVTLYTSVDGVSWTQLGAVVAAAAGDIFPGSSDLFIGSESGTAFNTHCSFLSAEIRDGIDGPVVYDFNADDLDIATDIGTSALGHVTTVYRTGDATAECIDRSAWQFTGSEYLEIADRASLNFPDKVVSLYSGFNSRSMSGVRLLSKRAGLLGYELYIETGQVGGFAGDGTDAAFGVQGPSVTDGTNRVLGVELDGTNIDRFIDGVANGPSTPMTNVDDISNTETLRVGRLTAGYSKALISWVAVWGRALTATERAELGAWDGRPGSAMPLCLYAATLYLNAEDEVTQDNLWSGAGLHNTMASLVHPNMGSAARRARKKAVGANAGSRLWRIDA